MLRYTCNSVVAKGILLMACRTDSRHNIKQDFNAVHITKDKLIYITKNEIDLCIILLNSYCFYFVFLFRLVILVFKDN